MCSTPNLKGPKKTRSHTSDHSYIFLSKTGRASAICLNETGMFYVEFN